MHMSTHLPDRRTEAAERMKRAKPNRLQKAQVLPPHQVDLTLAPDTSHDLHVAAHVTGGDLARGGPLVSGGTNSRKMR